MSFAAASETGKVRDHNEDRWSANAEAGLYIVADGMGGASHGELAAEFVVEMLPRYLEEAAADDDSSTPEQQMATAIAHVSDELNDRATNKPGRVGTGTTVVAALITGADCVIGHLGDSRAYLLRGGKAACLTTDHTIARILFDAGQLTAEEFAEHPGRNTLSRFVGMTPPGRPDVNCHVLQASDRLLLCTDGVSGALNADALQMLFAQPQTAQAVCNALVRAANEAGGRDNMTALVIDATYLGETVELQGLSQV